jgi:hypothetical protein
MWWGLLTGLATSLVGSWITLASGKSVVEVKQTDESSQLYKYGFYLLSGMAALQIFNHLIRRK